MAVMILNYKHFFSQGMLPANNDEIVLSDACENSDTSSIKEHLKFNFIPSKISDCSYVTHKRNHPATVRFLLFLLSNRDCH